MHYFKQIIRFAKPYKGYAILNIIANIFYALFGTLSMISLFPMLKVLFGDTKPLNEEPVWEGLGKITTYGEDYLNFFVTQKKAEFDKNGARWGEKQSHKSKIHLKMVSQKQNS